MMNTPESSALEETALPQPAAEQRRFALQAAPCLLRAKGLMKAFGGQVVLDAVDLTICQGEVILLRGENGSGKTTLLNILTGNVEPDAGTIHYLADGTPRSYEFPRRWWQELNPFDHFTPEFVAREGMGRTWQDVRLFGAQTLRDNIAVGKNRHPGENPLLALFAPGLAARREATIRDEVDAMLARLGLEGRESSSADKISLGQSKRVAIARAVAAGAKVLFLDEPLAGLDRQGITDVLALLENLVQEGCVTLVIVEHVFNQVHLRGLITTDWLLAAGQLMVSRAASTPSSAAQSVTPSRPDWFDLLTGPDAEVIDEPLPRGGLFTRIRRPGVFQEPPKPVLEIRDLVVKRGGRTVIGLNHEGEAAGFDLTLYEGEITLIQAPNGWGKSTLLEAILGFLKPVKGEILLKGMNIGALRPWDLPGKGLCALTSMLNNFPNLSGREALRLADTGGKTPKADLILDRPCSSLSGGQRQRLALWIMPTGVMEIYDEPFSGLDNPMPFLHRLSTPKLAHQSILVLSPSSTSPNQ